MSRIGKLPIQIPEGVTVTISGNEVSAKGGKATLSLKLPMHITAEVADSTVLVKNSGGKEFSKFHGLSRTLVANLIEGANNGYEKKLEIIGVGYRAAVQGDKLTLNIGLSHPVEVKAPEGVTFGVEKNVITISGADKQVVGQAAARIRALKKPEPYKGKGIKYAGERIRRKAGKSAAKGAKAE